MWPTPNSNGRTGLGPVRALQAPTAHTNGVLSGAPRDESVQFKLVSIKYVLQTVSMILCVQCRRLSHATVLLL